MTSDRFHQSFKNGYEAFRVVLRSEYGSESGRIDQLQSYDPLPEYGGDKHSRTTRSFDRKRFVENQRDREGDFPGYHKQAARNGIR